MKLGTVIRIVRDVINMIDRDYSQHGEQELILKFFNEKTDGYARFCVDVGAYDGVVGSNSRALFLSGWAGLAIEPNPRTFERLKALYQDRHDITCLRLAVSDRDAAGVEMLFAVGPEGVAEEDKWKYAQVSTLNDDFAETYRRDMAYRYEKSTVDVAELGALMRRHNVPRNFGFLSIDCEGEDIKIVRKLDLEEFAPQLILVESDDNNRHLYAEVIEPQGYQYYGHTPGNTLFARVKP